MTQTPWLAYVTSEVKQEAESPPEERQSADVWRQEAHAFGDHMIGALRQVVLDEMKTARARGLCIHQVVIGLNDAIDVLASDRDNTVRAVQMMGAVLKVIQEARQLKERDEA